MKGLLEQRCSSPSPHNLGDEQGKSAPSGFTPKIRKKQKERKSLLEPGVKRKTPPPNKEESAQEELTSMDFDEDFAKSETEKRELRAKQRRKFVSILLSLLCVYMVYLIYGAVVTDFSFDEKGLLAAETKTVDEIKEQRAFEEVASYYYRARSIYEDCLTLDYRIAQGRENPLVIAPEYDAMLDTIGKLSIDLQALSVETEYSQIRNMLINWVGTDIAVYCQNMSASISQNNSEKAQQAILGREVCYNDMATLTTNMVSMGSTIKGVDISPISDWSTDKFVADELEGGKYDE